MKTWVMASRNILRSRRRSLVTTLTMAFALMIMINMTGLFQGMINDVKRNMSLMEMGHLQIHNSEYRDKPSIYKKIDDPLAIVSQLEKEGFKASYRMFAAGLAAKDSSSAGAGIEGVDPDLEKNTVKMPSFMLSGKWLDKSDDKGVVLGRNMARSLKAEVGSEIVLVSQAADGSLANDLYNVRGILKSVNSKINRGGLLMTEKAFRDFMVMPEGAHQIAVSMPEDMDLQDALKEVSRIASNEEVRTWKQISPFLAQWVDNSDAWLIPTIAIMYMAVVIVILNAMLMAVFERIREYGVMKALGVSPGTVFSLVMKETVVMTVIAGVVGLLIGVPLLFYFQSNGIDLASFKGDMVISGIAMETIWRADASAYVIAMPLIMLLILALVATIYPALKAARLNPIDAIRHQ